MPGFKRLLLCLILCLAAWELSGCASFMEMRLPGEFQDKKIKEDPPPH